MIAKTMSFYQGEQVILILTEGTARIDNRKYKDTFHIKAKMIPFEEVEAAVGHAPGGVCPFGIKEGIKVYLDKSLKQFDTVSDFLLRSLHRSQGLPGSMCVRKQLISLHNTYCKTKIENST